MKISETKLNKIKEDILAVLFRNSPKALFTSAIAAHLARDEEFIKKLLIDLEKKNFIAGVKKNPQGIDYARRIRWRLTNQAFLAYQKVNSQNIKYDEENHTYF